MGRYRPTAPWGSRSALTATNNSLTPTSIPAASGCKMGNSSHRFFDLFAIGSSEYRPDAQGANQGKLPIEIVVTADERHHTSVRKPRTHASRRASEAPVSARAVAVIRPVPIIIALYPVPLHPVWQTPVARFLVSIPLFRPHLATKHAIHKNEVAESEAHPQRPPNKPYS